MPRRPPPSIPSPAELDGKYPQAALIRDSAGNLFGTTTAAGVLHDWHGVQDRLLRITSPCWMRSLAGDGVPDGWSGDGLRGATSMARPGTEAPRDWEPIYKIDTANNLTVLYNFDDSDRSPILTTR